MAALLVTALVTAGDFYLAGRAGGERTVVTGGPGCGPGPPAGAPTPGAVVVPHPWGGGPVPPDFLLLNLPSLRLQVWRDGVLRGCFPAAIGKPAQPTPTGIYRVVAKRMYPTWYPPEGGPPVPPGPENPLGSRFLALSLPTYGLHGTNAPRSIGRAVSRGCVRLAEEHVARVWRWAYPGIPVRIVYERVLADRASWGVTLVLWPDPYGRMPLAPDDLTAHCPWPGEMDLLVRDALDWAQYGPALVVAGSSPRPGAEDPGWRNLPPW